MRYFSRTYLLAALLLVVSPLMFSTPALAQAGELSAADRLFANQLEAAARSALAGLDSKSELTAEAANSIVAGLVVQFGSASLVSIVQALVAVAPSNAVAGALVAAAIRLEPTQGVAIIQAIPGQVGVLAIQFFTAEQLAAMGISLSTLNTSGMETTTSEASNNPQLSSKKPDQLPKPPVDIPISPGRIPPGRP
jgi:hypothetical protein